MSYLVTRHNSQGFSLLELSVVLMIAGLVGVGSLAVYSEQRTHAKWMESDAKLKVVKSALLEFAGINKYMPCPSALDDGLDARNFSATGNMPAIAATPAVPATPKTAISPSIPAIPSQGAMPAIANLPVATCQVNSGSVPYDAIGLSRADVSDSWGNLFLYAVDQGVTNGNLMLDCPTQTACFFNKDSFASLSAATTTANMRKLEARRVRGVRVPFLPAFDFTTKPFKGQVGGGNLRICTSSTCSTVDAEGLVAILVALNENGGSSAVLAVDEADNQDGDVNFVRTTYSETPYFDDLMLGISASDLKKTSELDSLEIIVTPSVSGGTTLSGNDIQGMGDNTIGTVGTNIGTDTAQRDGLIQSFDFGKEAAHKSIVLTLETHASGAWDKAATTYRGVFDDRGEILSNGERVHLFDYDHLDDPRDGLEEATFVSAINGRYSDTYNADGSWDSRVFLKGRTYTTWQPYWNETHEFIVTADESGKVDIEFAVQTTATIETIDFTNIELAFYDTPGDIPDFPSVLPISGIPETEGLE